MVIILKERRTPVRMCAGCGEMKPKTELVRIVKSPQGEISIDLTGKKAGRGTYICKNPECVKKAKKTRRIERAFKCKIEPEIYDGMENIAYG